MLSVRVSAATYFHFNSAFHFNHHHQNAGAAEVRSANLVRRECPRPTARPDSKRMEAVEPSSPIWCSQVCLGRPGGLLQLDGEHRHTRLHMSKETQAPASGARSMCSMQEQWSVFGRGPVDNTVGGPKGMEPAAGASTGTRDSWSL